MRSINEIIVELFARAEQAEVDMQRWRRLADALERKIERRKRADKRRLELLSSVKQSRKRQKKQRKK